MRIAYLSASSIPSRAANSVHVMKMCQALAGAGHELMLLARDGTPADTANSDDFRFYGVEPRFALVKCRVPRPPVGGGALYALALKARLKAHARPELFYGRSLLGLLAVADWGVPLIYEVHSAPASFLHRRLEARLFRVAHFARLVAISDSLRREYLRLHPHLDEDKAIAAHDAADPPRPTGTEQLPESLRRPGTRLRAGYVGHLYPGRGIELIAELARRMPEVEFHIIGGTERDVARWRSDTEDRENFVVHGYVSPVLADAYRQAVDVLLAPYQEKVSVERAGEDTGRWMSPLKIFEYMASGKPIVASDLPVLREVLAPEREALLAPPCDVNAWERVLRRMTNPELRRQVAARAWAKFQQQHTWARRAEKVLNNL